MTRRQRQVLTLVACGKSQWEIGVILGIEERTVRFFYAGLRDRLDVVSMPQAVAVGICLGLVDCDAVMDGRKWKRPGDCPAS